MYQNNNLLFSEELDKAIVLSQCIKKICQQLTHKFLKVKKDVLSDIMKSKKQEKQVVLSKKKPKQSITAISL